MIKLSFHYELRCQSLGHELWFCWRLGEYFREIPLYICAIVDLFPGSILWMAAGYLGGPFVSSSAAAQLGRECENGAFVSDGSLTRAVLW